MSMTSHFTDKCRYCGDEMRIVVGTNECDRCLRIIDCMRRCSFPEIERLIDAAARVPNGTYKIVNPEISKDNSQ